ADGSAVVLPLHLSDADATTSIATADINGDGSVDILAGNLDQFNRFYINDGAGGFGLGRNVFTDTDLTTSVGLADLNQDGRPDIVAGNLGFDLGEVIRQGLIRVTDFVEDTVINIVDLVSSGLVSLLDLVEQELIDRFDFDPLAPITIADILNAGITELADLVREGLLALEDFTDIDLDADAITATGLLTNAQLLAAGLINAAGNVSLHDLVNSGIITLEQLIGRDLVDENSLNIPTITLGSLLSTPLADLRSIIAAGLADAADLLREQLHLRELIESGIVDLANLAQEELLDLLDLDQQRVDLQDITDQLAFGGTTKVYFQDATGSFLPPLELGQDITKGVAIGDVTGDGRPDIIVGNSGTGTRLYRNIGGNSFDTGTRITEIGPLTTGIALGDMDGDNDLDLVVVNFGTTNRLYLNDGSGNFSAGTDISVDANTSSSVVLGDVDGDGAIDVLAGDSKPAIAAAGSLSRFDAAIDGKAWIDSGAVVDTPQSVNVSAVDDATIVTIAGADASGTFASVGLSVGSANIVRDVAAFVLGNVIAADGTGFSEPSGLFVEARSHDDVLAYASGSATADDVAVVASANIPTMESITEAYIAGKANIELLNATESQDVGLHVTAVHDTNTLGFAGGFGGAFRLGVGAAGDGQLFDKTTRAYVSGGADIAVRDDVVVDASSHDTSESTAVGIGAALELGIAGSVSMVSQDTTTHAYIENAKIDANGNVIVQTESDANIDTFVGAEGLGLLGGVGLSASIIPHSDRTESWIGEGATILARGLRDSSPVRTETRGITRPLRGVAVTANSYEEIHPITIGASASLLLGLAGSVNVTVLDETTRAFIGAGSQVDRFEAPDAAHIDQGIYVFAFDDTQLTGLAGTLSATLVAGLGAGIDTAIITKHTEAFIEGDVAANLHVEVVALSEEELTSISATLDVAAGLPVAVLDQINIAGGGSAALYVVAPSTTAYVGGHVSANGNIVVWADDVNEVDIISGNAAIANSNAVGGSLGAVVFNKTTEAYVDSEADVTALGLRGDSDVHTGTFTVDYTFDPLRLPLLPIALGLGVLGFVFDNPLKDSIGDAFGLTPVSAPPDDRSLTSKRKATPATRTSRGLAVSATSRDDVESLVVGFAASGELSLLTAQASASAVVAANETRAYVDRGAKVNNDLTGADSGQSVLVAAGSDTFHFAATGGAALSDVNLVGSVGAGIGLMLTDNLTEAYVAEDAVVKSVREVQVEANATQDALLFVAGFTEGAAMLHFILPNLGGSLPIASFGDRTFAYVDKNATVFSDGNIIVSANSDTDVDLIAGAAALSSGFTGVGMSAAMTIISKETQAWIGEGAHVDAKGNGGTATVLSGSVEPDFPTEQIRGLSVEARSSESVFNLALAGATGMAFGIAGGAGAAII
ncbi:MAG: VCBS repeat-containing protein, partial [Planctomycetales bacterium]|nr:VCBS repeat-containing protein [Planctomycetales bacterium]